MKKRISFILRDVGIMFLMLAVATIIGLLFQKWNFQMTNVVVVYILFVVITARFTNGYLVGIISSILSLLAFNWYFTEPYYTLKVNDLTYVLTFVIMTISAIITSALTTKFKKAAAFSKAKEEETNVLYRLTNHLTDAEDIPAIVRVTVEAISQLLNTPVACICFDDEKDIYLQKKEDGSLVHRELQNAEDLKHHMENLQTGYEKNGEECDWPVYGHDTILGILRLPAEKVETMSPAGRRMVSSILENSALAIERYRGIQVEAKNREEIEKERYRSNLLRSISHDIRTPLTGIMGSSEMLMSILPKEDYPHSLAEDIYKDANGLHSLVENILSLTRLQEGGVNLEKEPEAVEEVVDSVLRTMAKRLPDREIHVEIPDTLLLVPMNARLISQVLLNLLDNAAAHSNADTEILLKVEKEENVVRFSVLDRGEGLPKEDVERVFQMFYTTDKKIADAKRGIGLGLTICRSIIEAHGGKISAYNREDGAGAVFTFTLPLREEKTE